MILQIAIAPFLCGGSGLADTSAGDASASAAAHGLASSPSALVWGGPGASVDDAPAIQALKEVNAPAALNEAVEEALSATDPQSRSGVSTSVTVQFPGPDPGTKVSVVFAFGSASTVKRPEAARKKAALRAKGALVSAAWAAPLSSAAFPELFDDFRMEARLDDVEVNAWDGDGGWSWNLSICPLDQLTVDPKDVEAAWAHYAPALIGAARKEARSEDWNSCRSYLAELRTRGPLDRSGEILSLWLNYSDGPKAGDLAPVDAALRSWPRGSYGSPEMLEMIEFLFCAGLKDRALLALDLYRAASDQPLPR